MRISTERLTTKALLALEEAVQSIKSGPLQPSLAMRFALAFLYSVSNGSRAPFDDFWRSVQFHGDSYTQCVQRQAMASAALEAIYRDLGLLRTTEMASYSTTSKRINLRANRQEKD